ncbi:MAG: fused MFS/spermidine synthase [Magnetococcales bacterium]|nr:fused MFS/spermidine synthase [Magnetococcales bacterium]
MRRAKRAKRLYRCRREGGGYLEVLEDDVHRWMHFGSHLQQSSMRLEDPSELALPYTRRMMNALLFAPDPQRILMIGLGGGSMARFLLRHFPDACMDAVEMDPAVAWVAHHFFQLQEHPGLVIHQGEGLAYLRDKVQNGEQGYDLILVDAFDHEGMASVLLLEDFHRKCRALLSSNGVCAYNLSKRLPIPYETVLAGLRASYEGAALLPAEVTSNNVIAFALTRPLEADFKGVLRQRATLLSRVMNVEFSTKLTPLLAVTSPFWRNWLGGV